MSEESEKTENSGNEPSMEDILSSIRSILSDEEAEEGGDSVKGTVKPEVAEEPKREQEQEGDKNEDGTAELAEVEPEENPEPVADTDEAAELAGPEQIEEAPETAAPEVPEPMEDILELTPEMVANPDVMSQSTFQSSQDLLSELAKAILDRRDMGIATGTDATLEDMVREMVKPLLREWLDRNLPYMIERLVKKEIDHMINRAERLHF
ncbi:MAG: hypothetical protein CFH06_01441 [Alphaproteobacteria bacterium MarineAlpha3_Bin5]|nr:hypothetical protein [Magnetovibrio sp.]PPR77140.1 MAG: hypothetical protein CFH06_01441 [Alphaproteobacteria bacterium MarineAlpha3_Bin5]